MNKSAERELWVMKITAADLKQNTIANVKLLGNIHGNEAAGREILLHFIYVRNILHYGSNLEFIII